MNLIILNCVICVIILNSVSALRRGSSCNSGYGDGICKTITQCNVLPKMRINNQVPQMCGFDSNGPIVCCPRFSPREPETDKIEFDFDSNMQKDEEYNHNPNYFSYETKDNSRQDYSSEEFGGWGRNNDYTSTTSFWSNNKKKTTTNNHNVRPHYDSTTEHSRSHENTYRPHRAPSIENDNYQPHSSRPNTYDTENFDSFNNNNNRKPSNNNNWSGERPSNRPTSTTKRPNYNTEDEYRPTVSNSNNWSEERPYNNRPSTSNSQNWNNQRPNSNSNGWSSEGTSFNNPSSSRPNNNFGSSWFTSDKDDEDERPVWGDVPTRASTTQRTTTSSYNNWSKPQKRISQIKCDEYSELVTSQLRPLPLLPNPSGISVQIPKCEFNAASLIIGGDDAAIGEFPHMAAIGFRIRGTGAISWNCGGVLISEEYILTAAHCTFTDTNGKPKSVRLGGRDLLQDEDGEATEIAISQIIVHPQYDKNKRYNDIALLKLNRRVQFSKTIRPACLFDKDNIPVTKSIATGWGQTNTPRSTTSNILKKVELSLVSNYDCNQMFNRLSSHQSSLNQGISKTMLCAGERIGGRDTCQGDSGGPLQFSSEQNKCIHYVIGITSFGSIMCGEPESPGVYSKVSAFLPWIENIVWPE